jgi:AAA domain
MNPQNLPPGKTIVYTKMDQLDTFLRKVVPQPELPPSLLNVKPANQWLTDANKRPIPKMLFGKFWFEGELCILFADSNLGKSILAVQIANSISSGEKISPFELTADKQPVLYCDFELTDKQFEARYSDNYADHYVFNQHFFRAEQDPDQELPPGISDFNEFLSLALEREIIRTKAKTLVIDNLTYLRNETEQAKDALPLMKHLKALKNKYNLSILALAHTPKRDLSLEITRNDLQGSKMLMNFCDSAFTIGESMFDRNLRYLKQIKQRNTEQIYGSNNVCLCQTIKPSNFLKFEFVSYGKEAEHLRKPKDSGETDARINEILALRDKGLSLREIGLQLGITHQKVSRLIQTADAQK